MGQLILSKLRQRLCALAAAVLAVAALGGWGVATTSATRASAVEQRYEIARILREGAYGRDAPDVREAERSCRPKDLDDLQRLPRA